MTFHNMLFWFLLEKMSPKEEGAFWAPWSAMPTGVAVMSPRTCSGVAGASKREGESDNCRQEEEQWASVSAPEGPRRWRSTRLWRRVCPGRKPQGIPSQPALAHLLTTPEAEPWVPWGWQELSWEARPSPPGRANSSLVSWLHLITRLPPLVRIPTSPLLCAQVVQPSLFVTSESHCLGDTAWAGVEVGR